jgi:hypothetical protein
MEEPTIEDLLLAGAIEVYGVDSDTGEFLYNFTNKMQDILPELYKEHINDVHNEVMYFWEHGAVEMTEMESDNPKIRLTERAFDESFVASLPEDKRDSLEQIKRILKVV